MQKIVYIAGLGHSGSTTLDMMLSTTRRAVGLGQVWTVLREDPAKTHTRSCSCGASAPKCEFWGPLIAKLGTRVDPRERYRLVLDRAAELYGPQTTVVDSSKQVANIIGLAETLRDVDLRIVHNIKDVRAYTVSTLDNELRKHNRKPIPEWVFYEWYRGNRSVHNRAAKLLGQPPFQLMYEALCFATENVARQIAAYLGEDYIDPAAALNSGNTHIISGNRLRLSDNGSSKRLTYDHRWFVRSEWLRPYVLMPAIRRFNERCLRECVKFGTTASVDIEEAIAAKNHDGGAAGQERIPANGRT